MSEDKLIRLAKIIEKAPEEIRPLLRSTAITLETMGEEEAKKAIKALLFTSRVAFETMTGKELVTAAPAALLEEWDEANANQAENIDKLRKLAEEVLLSLINVLLTMC